MDRLLWALGSMLFITVIIFFLPLGFTKKGKLLIVFTGFLLALGGLAAIASFSLWMTLTILSVLAVLVGFMMDKRLGTYLYEKSISVEPLHETALEMAVGHDDTDVNESDLNENLFHDELETEKMDVRSQHSEMNLEKMDGLPVFEEEGISFLNARNVDSVEEETGDADIVSKGYLSEIEAMLVKNNNDLEDREDFQGLSASDEEELHVLSFNDKTESKIHNEAVKQNEEVIELEELPVLTFNKEGGKET